MSTVQQAKFRLKKSFLQTTSEIHKNEADRSKTQAEFGVKNLKTAKFRASFEGVVAKSGPRKKFSNFIVMTFYENIEDNKHCGTSFILIHSQKTTF